jgi:hypothetical protein
VAEILLRYRMRETAQAFTHSRGVQKCGRALAFSPDGVAGVSLCVPAGGEGGSYFAGLLRCSSVWECPICQPKIQAMRAEELGGLNRAHGAAGGGLYLATLTVPHDVGDDLKPLRKAVSKAWQRVQQGKPWQTWRARLGLIGTARAMEVTHGGAGWHPHLHVALYTEAPVDRQTLGSFERWLFDRWRDKITMRTPEGNIYRAPLWETVDRETGERVRVGVTVQPLSSAKYLAKMGLARETASSWTKKGRTGHRTPMQILRDISERPGCDEQGARDRALWSEWARAMKGARQLTYSRGLFDRYGLREIVNDEDLPDQPDLEGLAVGEAEVVHTFTSAEWCDVLAAGPAFRVRLLMLPQTVPRAEWKSALQSLFDEMAGLPPVPF